MNRMDERGNHERRIWPQEMSLGPASLLLLVLFLTFAFIGCGKSDTSPTQPGDRMWTISGTTHTLGFIDPLPGVVVKCAGITATSGSDGTYELRGIPEGKQTITAQKTECENYSFVVDVLSDVRHYIFMTIDGADLSGVVSNALDGPVSDARVVVHGRTGTTDAFGRYEFSLVPHGTDTLSVTHPRYTAYKAAITLAGSAMEQNVVLKKDSALSGYLRLAKHVYEWLPNQIYFTPFDRMYLRSVGYDDAGQYYASLREHIYITFDFPILLADRRVSILDASLQICSDGSYPQITIQTFSVQSIWFDLITYNSQPQTGSLLFSGSICDSSGAKFWTVLGTEGFNQLLTEYRTKGLTYGVVIKGGRVVAPTGFYSGYATLSLRPKVTFRVRY